MAIAAAEADYYKELGKMQRKLFSIKENELEEMWRIKKTPAMTPYANMSHMEVVQQLLALTAKLD